MDADWSSQSDALTNFTSSGILDLGLSVDRFLKRLMRDATPLQADERALLGSRLVLALYSP